MKILINSFSARQGGGQTYLINLLKFLPRDYPHEVFVLAPDDLDLAVDRPNITRLRVAAPVENPFFRALWEKFRLPGLIRNFGIKVLFCPGGIIGTAPPAGCKTVTMFRNMIPFDLEQRRRYPLGYQRLRNWLLNKLMLSSLLRADKVIFISDYARQVIERAARRTFTASVTIPHGINPQFKTAEHRDVPRPAWLPDTGYLLYVSTLDFYKAQIEVVRGFALMKEQRPTREKLILVGPENADYGRRVRDEIARHQLEAEVILTGPLPYRDLPALYHHALINVFASESENCPNILLEALASGRPVVCSDKPPMPEFGGDAVVYFDPRSPENLAARLLGLIDDTAQMTALSAKARERALRYDWDNAARQTWSAIAKLEGNVA
jgi:glycosyltransferase involved in cell wall biosynthesis